MWFWIAAGWLACGAVLVVAERMMSRSGEGMWDDDDQIVSIAAYGLLVVLAPVMVVIIFGMVVKVGPKGLWALITRNPFVAPETEWLDQGPTGFIADLVRRRQKRDTRLKGEDIGNWLMWRFEGTPDAMILDVVTKYRALNAAGVADAHIWDRLEAHRFEKGEGRLPSPCDLRSYVEYRLGLEDPDYLRLGADFIDEQIAYCEKYACYQARRREERDWPPSEWFGRKISLAEFEREGDGTDPIIAGAPAALRLGDDSVRADLMDLKFLLLPEDELWTFSSPPEYWAKLFGCCGVVLLRNAHPVGHVITIRN